jgi:serine protease SohB
MYQRLMAIKHKVADIVVSIDRNCIGSSYLVAVVGKKIISSSSSLIGGFDQDSVKYTDQEYVILKMSEEKFKILLEKRYQSFINQILLHRKMISLKDFKSGEIWLGSEILEKKIIDQIITSQEFINNFRDKYEICEL